MTLQDITNPAVVPTDAEGYAQVLFNGITDYQAVPSTSNGNLSYVQVNFSDSQSLAASGQIGSFVYNPEAGCDSPVYNIPSARSWRGEQSCF